MQEGKSSASMEDVEREHIISILIQTQWQVHGDKGAAKILEINPSTLKNKNG